MGGVYVALRFSRYTDRFEEGIKTKKLRSGLVSFWMCSYIQSDPSRLDFLSPDSLDRNDVGNWEIINICFNLEATNAEEMFC